MDNAFLGTPMPDNADPIPSARAKRNRNSKGRLMYDGVIVGKRGYVYYLKYVDDRIVMETVGGSGEWGHGGCHSWSIPDWLNLYELFVHNHTGAGITGEVFMTQWQSTSQPLVYRLEEPCYWSSATDFIFVTFCSSAFIKPTSANVLHTPNAPQPAEERVNHFSDLFLVQRCDRAAVRGLFREVYSLIQRQREGDRFAGVRKRLVFDDSCDYSDCPTGNDCVYYENDETACW